MEQALDVERSLSPTDNDEQPVAVSISNSYFKNDFRRPRSAPLSVDGQSSTSSKRMTKSAGPKRPAVQTIDTDDDQLSPTGGMKGSLDFSKATSRDQRQRLSPRAPHKHITNQLDYNPSCVAESSFKHTPGLSFDSYSSREAANRMATWHGKQTDPSILSSNGTITAGSNTYSSSPLLLSVVPLPDRPTSALSMGKSISREQRAKGLARMTIPIFNADVPWYDSSNNSVHVPGPDMAKSPKRVTLFEEKHNLEPGQEHFYDVNLSLVHERTDIGNRNFNGYGNRDRPSSSMCRYTSTSTRDLDIGLQPNYFQNKKSITVTDFAKQSTREVAVQAHRDAPRRKWIGEVLPLHPKYTVVDPKTDRSLKFGVQSKRGEDIETLFVKKRHETYAGVDWPDVVTSFNKSKGKLKGAINMSKQPGRSGTPGSRFQLGTQHESTTKALYTGNQPSHLNVAKKRQPQEGRSGNRFADDMSETSGAELQHSFEEAT